MWGRGLPLTLDCGYYDRKHATTSNAFLPISLAIQVFYSNRNPLDILRFA